MREAADELEFERRPAAGPARRVRKAIEKQQMVADRNEDLDVIGIADDELEASVQVFFVAPRAGWWAARASSSTRSRTLDPGRSRRPHPRGALRRRADPRRAQAGARARRARRRRRLYEEWLATSAGPGRQVRVPQRGDKRELLETVTRNAQEEFTRHRLRRAADHNSRARASTSSRTCSTCPRRRCASSATTWPTSRAPTTWARWS